MLWVWKRQRCEYTFIFIRVPNLGWCLLYYACARSHAFLRGYGVLQRLSPEYASRLRKRKIVKWFHLRPSTSNFFLISSEVVRCNIGITNKRYYHFVRPVIGKKTSILNCSVALARSKVTTLSIVIFFSLSIVLGIFKLVGVPNGHDGMILIYSKRDEEYTVSILWTR